MFVYIYMSAPNDRRRRKTTMTEVDQKTLMDERKAIQEEIPELKLKALPDEPQMILGQAKLNEIERRAIMAQLESDRYVKFYKYQPNNAKNNNKLSLANAWYDIKNREPLNDYWTDQGNSGGFLMKDEKGITRKYDRGSLK